MDPKKRCPRCKRWGRWMGLLCDRCRAADEQPDEARRDAEYDVPCPDRPTRTNPRKYGAGALR